LEEPDEQRAVIKFIGCWRRHGALLTGAEP
jgi:hypothetical protein